MPQGPSTDGTTSGATWINMMVVPTVRRNRTWRLNSAGHVRPGSPGAELLMVNQVSPRLDFYNTPEWSKAVEDLPQLGVVPDVGARGKAYPFFRRYTSANEQWQIVRDALSGESDSTCAALWQRP